MREIAASSIIGLLLSLEYAVSDLSFVVVDESGGGQRGERTNALLRQNPGLLDVPLVFDLHLHMHLASLTALHRYQQL